MAFVPKSRRPKYDLTLRILDLNNVPLVSGSSFVKWHLPSSTAAEHRGRTQKCPIKDHRVQYEYEKHIPVRLTVGKDGMLQECQVHFEVLQEYSASGRGERIALGNVRLNLAEYVEASEAQSSSHGTPGENEGVVRRYLMQDSKINSTLKIAIFMRQTEGSRDYYAPPLRTAPVFGGIAGIIGSSEPASTTHGVASHTDEERAHDAGDGPVPNLSASSKEVGEMQDMYRRTLAAYWASEPGELKADECIEDIFAGGDGWGKSGRPRSSQQLSGNNAASGSETSTPNPADSQRDGSQPSTPTSGRWREDTMRSGGATGKSTAGMRGNNSIFASSKKRRYPRKGAGEVDEFDIREDLRSWRVGEKACS